MAIHIHREMQVHLFEVHGGMKVCGTAASLVAFRPTGSEPSSSELIEVAGLPHDFWTECSLIPLQKLITVV
jgi:hypothetical protein